jgi:predicted homoserine dehydrogenase-like protein
MTIPDAARPVRVGIVGLGSIGSELARPLVGVSGTEMVVSAWSSLRTAAGRPSTSGIV